MADATRKAILKLLEIDREFAFPMSVNRHSDCLSELFETLGELREAYTAESGLKVERTPVS
jgi:hypothetical protein